MEGLVKYKKILFVIALVLILGLIRYFNNLTIYHADPHLVVKDDINIVNNIYEDEYFVLWKSLIKGHEDPNRSSTNKILVLHFFDMISASKYFIWNHTKDNLKFFTPWFSLKLQKGLTKIYIYNSGKYEIFHPDNSIVRKRFYIANFYSSSMSDIKPIQMNSDESNKFQELIRKGREVGYTTRNKLLSLYFYITTIILLIFSVKGLKVYLASFFYVFMFFLFKEMFVLGGILFDIPYLVSSPQTFIVKAVIFFLILFCIRVIYNGIKKVKSLNFYEIGIVILFSLIPWLLYF